MYLTIIVNLGIVTQDVDYGSECDCPANYLCRYTSKPNTRCTDYVCNYTSLSVPKATFQVPS